MAGVKTAPMAEDAGMPAAGLSLREIQDRFQAAILSGDDAALADIMDNSRTGREVLFGVYRNAYVSRLIEVIGNDHGLLHTYLGDDGFDAMARAYIAAHPSRTQNARWVSKFVPVFLRTTEPYSAYPVIDTDRRCVGIITSSDLLSGNLDDEAQLGDFKIKVIGHPTQGGDAQVEFKLTVAAKDSFTLSLPYLSTGLKQGETQTVSIGINRGKTLNEDVTLKFEELPKGVTIEPSSPVIKHGDMEAKLTVKTAETAALGDFTIKVTGHPTKGADASNEFKLTVDKK